LLANAAGQGVGMLRKVRPAAQVVEQMMFEAAQIVSGMCGPALSAGATA
jgi:hypothetical protein